MVLKKSSSGFGEKQHCAFEGFLTAYFSCNFCILISAPIWRATENCLNWVSEEVYGFLMENNFEFFC